MSFLDLPSYINDAMCALSDKEYYETNAIMTEAQPLINAAESRIKYLADCIKTWAGCIKENGLTDKTENYADFLNDDNKELQKVIDVLVEVNDFKLRLRDDTGYQNYQQKAAA